MRCLSSGSSPSRRSPAASRSREVSAAEVTEAALARTAQVEPLIAAYLEVFAEEARAARGRDRPADRRGRGPGSARRCAGGAQGQPEPGRPPPDLRLADPRRLRRPLHRDRGRAAARGRRGGPRPGQHGRVRHGLVVRELGVSSRPATRGTSRRCRADRAAGRRRRWRRAACRWASARTPAARSASRRRCAASSGSSRPTAGSRATAWSPSPRRPTRSVRWPATCATPRSASR